MNSETSRNRHGCVTLWLGANVVLGLILMPTLLSFTDDLNRVFPVPLVYLFLAVPIGEAICGIGILLWRKWAVYGYIALWIAGIVLRLYMGIFQARSVGTAVVTAIFMFGFILPNIENYD